MSEHDAWPTAKASISGGINAKISTDYNDMTSAEEIARIAAEMDKIEHSQNGLGPKPVLKDAVPLPRLGAPAQVIDVSAGKTVENMLDAGYEILNSLGTEFEA